MHKVALNYETLSLSERVLLTDRMCLSALSTHVPRLKEAAPCWVIKLTGLGNYLGYSSGVLRAFLDKPIKRTQWDSPSLSHCQLDANLPDLSQNFKVIEPYAGV